MKMRVIMPLALVAASMAGTAARAQNFLNMDISAYNARLNAQRNAQMNGVRTHIVDTNVNNPMIVAAWRRNSRGMSLKQYAYMYGATAGFTPGGIARYNNTTNEIAHNEYISVMDSRSGTDNLGKAIAERNGHAGSNLTEAGRGLMGQSTHVNPMTGEMISLSNLPSATTVRRGGWTYQPIGNGRYWASNGSQGGVVEQAAEAPR